MMFLKLFIFDVSNSRTTVIIEEVRNISDYQTGKKELRNISDVRRGEKSSPCYCGNNTNYRDNLKFMLNILHENVSSQSTCKMLMDESVILRAIDYGTPLHRELFDKQLVSTNDTVSVAIRVAKNNSQKSQRDRSKSCRAVGFSKTALPRTALASFPGSGNTWVRHLLQQATGKRYSMKKTKMHIFALIIAEVIVVDNSFVG